METNSLFSTKENTRVRQSAYGWLAETFTNAAGSSWAITTCKRSNGRVSTHCQRVQDEGSNSFSYSIFTNNPTDAFTILIESVPRVTEKAVRDVHFKGLALFDAKVQSGELGTAKDKYTLKPGQIVWVDGPWPRQDYALCEDLGRGRWNAAALDGSGFRQFERIRDYKDKFGIGSYYNEGEVIGEDELANLVIDCHNRRKADNEAAEVARAAAEKAKSDAIAKGREAMPELPAWAKSVIIARLKVDKSDIQSDYFGHTTEKVLILALSAHTRNDFNEMRKAAANCPETAHLQADGKENRDDYSGGHGYWLGESLHSGWEVVKNRYDFTLEYVQRAIGEGRCFIPTAARAAMVNGGQV